MKNKTKTKTNLKRAILFFIPLCLIVGMFAVPTFAIPPVHDDVQSLANTDATLNDAWTAPEGTGQFNVNGYYTVTYSNGSKSTNYFDQLDVGYDNDGSPYPTDGYITFHVDKMPYTVPLSASHGRLTIHFIDGDDIGNTNLIFWLQSNGTITPSVVWDEKSGYLTPIDLPNGSSSLGWYAIQLDADDIIHGMNAVRNVHEGEFSFNVFGNNVAITNGYIFIDYVSNSDSIVRLRDGSVYAYFEGTLASDHLCIPDKVGSNVTALAQDINDINSVTFIVDSYPPVFLNDANSSMFWDTAVYSVYEYTDNSPEEPDDPTPPAEGEEQGIFAVWTQITDWIINGLKSTTNAFYFNGQLTLLGYLCIIPLALGVALLLISIIQKYLHLRG